MKASLILIPALFAASTATFAERPHGRWHAPVSIDEAEAESAERFSAIDADGDGKLTAEELFSEENRAARKAEMQQRRFDRLDADGNGLISSEEFGKRTARLAQLDTDHDGQVTHEELRAARHGKGSKRKRDG